MDTFTAQSARTALRQRHLELMRSPSPERWALYPFLPLSRPREPGDGPELELGVLSDAQALGTPGYQAVVFLVNVYALGTTISTLKDLLAQPQLRYESLGAVVAAGWLVD